MVSMMDQGSTSVKASGPATVDSGVKVFGNTRLQLRFTQVMAFSELKKPEHDKPIIIIHYENLWQFSEQE